MTTVLFLLALVVISCFLMPARFDRAVRRAPVMIQSRALIRVIKSRK